MKFTYEPTNQMYFVTNLRKRDDRLKWDTARNGGMSLVLQGRFGEDIAPAMDKICEKLGTLDASLGENFVSLAPEVPYVYAQLLDVRRNARVKASGGLKIREDVSRFTVMACCMRGDECVIFLPGRRQTVDVPAEIQIVCQKVYDHMNSGLFGLGRGRTEFAGFYEVRISGNCANTYQDGSICYMIGELAIPVTRKMMEAERFYIKAQEIPPFQSKNEGYSISLREIE